MLHYFVALLTLWTLVVRGNASQPYCTYEVLGEQTRVYLRDKLNFIEPTPYQRSFAALLYAIHRTGEIVSYGVNYDDAYNNAKVLVKIGNLSPQYARDYFLNILKEIEAKIKPVNYWVHQNLGSGNPDDLKTCDQKVTNIVNSHPASARAAKLVIEVGKLSELFQSLKGELEKVAASHTEVQYIENGRRHLRPFILQVAVVFRILRS